MRTAAACMCGSNTVIFVGCGSVWNASIFLPASIAADVDVAGADRDLPLVDLRLVALRVELEPDLEVTGRVLPVGVHVHVGEADARAGAQQLAGLGIEDVGVASDFVHRPAADDPGRAARRPAPRRS